MFRYINGEFQAYTAKSHITSFRNKSVKIIHTTNSLHPGLMNFTVNECCSLTMNMGAEPVPITVTKALQGKVPFCVQDIQLPYVTI